jgi:hypothetical protein
MTSIFLWNKSSTGITIDFGFSINDGKGKQVAHKRYATPHYFGPPPDANGKGWVDFAERSTLMNCLVNGTLIVEVHMKLSVPVKSSPPPPFILQ